MHSKHLLPIFLLLVTGCVTTRTSQTTTPLVELPTGGQIAIEVVQHKGSNEPGRGPLAIWKTSDGERKTLITLVPAPGSPVDVLRIESSSPRFSTDGNRCWLLRNNEPIASFDYVSGVAVLGPAGQPEWAKPDEAAQ